MSNYITPIYIKLNKIYTGLHLIKLRNITKKCGKNLSWKIAIGHKPANSISFHSLSSVLFFPPKYAFSKKSVKFFTKNTFFGFQFFLWNSSNFVERFLILLKIFILKWPLKNLSNLALILKARIWECLIEIWMALLVLQVNIGGAVV